jgi:hypothetical protein
MVDVTIDRYSITGTLSATYKIKGGLEMRERKSQMTGAVPVPFTSDVRAILANLTGQQREFNCGFIMLERSDDYTGSTGSPGTAPYTTRAQKNWLMDNVFTANGFHVLTDENGDQYAGRITDIEVSRRGDNPVSYDCTFKFIRGTTAGI